MNNKMIAEEKIKNAEGVLNTKAFALFPSLLTSISTGEESKTNEITIEKLSFILSLYGKSANVTPSIQDIILRYNLPNSIMENRIKNGKNPNSFTQETFAAFLSGKDVKDTLFNLNLNDKRKKVELLTSIFYVLGGNKDGISVQNVEKSLVTFYAMLTEPENYLAGREVSGKGKEFAQKTIGEIEELLVSKDAMITLNDFINMMTSESYYYTIEDEELMF